MKIEVENAVPASVKLNLESDPMPRTHSEFQHRHIGPDARDTATMLDVIGVDSVDTLMDQTVPVSIRLTRPLSVCAPRTEAGLLHELKAMAMKNQLFKSYIGMGYHPTEVPSVILRNIFENPGWYTQYTPYQSEISQGRLEALLNFQTMVTDLTGLDIANASLLDEGTAAAEAMTVLHRSREKALIDRNANTFVVADTCFPHTIDVVIGRAEPLGINVVLKSPDNITLSDDVFGILVQYPDMNGTLIDYSGLIKTAHETGIRVAMAADLLSLTLLKSPGEMGADLALGTTQRFGVPMGFGGAHAAYFAAKDELKRQIPGRIIGMSQDRLGQPAYRMSLQTREQHIRREKATSNICTSQSLVAIMAGMYAVYHGPEGLKRIAQRIRLHATQLAHGLTDAGFTVINAPFFDTLKINTGFMATDKIRPLAEAAGMNFRYIDQQHISISLNELVSTDDIQDIITVFAKSIGLQIAASDWKITKHAVPDAFRRTSGFLTHPVFNRYHTETAMMRYIKTLEKKDLALNTAMIPLGSCTMKLNSATSMLPLTWPEFGDIHPFAPLDQTKGYQELLHKMELWLGAITGLPAVSLQPNSGAAGEYAGLMAIRAYHAHRDQNHRNVVLIPSSAHGTNPASAALAGMDIVIVDCDEKGNIHVNDLVAKAEANQEKLACLMVTYPSTHGVFEDAIKTICERVHQYGGLVYMDGANMNAQVGLSNPAAIGADVCHLNLHKTFATPHGGGGPGMGPICVSKQLAAFLPDHAIVPLGHPNGIHAVASAPYGSAVVHIIAYAYIRMLGNEGLTNATKWAILNANYIKSRLEPHYPILYTGEKGRVAHEMIVDFREFKKTAGIEVEDVAKRLMDYGFHAPTMSFPVPGTLMIEPTESEPKSELDRFCDAMIAIRQEIEAIANGSADKEDNVLKNAPHTAEEACGDAWTHPYSRTQAVYPVDSLKSDKFWPACARVNNAYGDRNLKVTL